MFSPECYCVREHYAVATIYLLHATSYLQRVMPQSKPNTHTIFINNIQGTGLETCHVSASTKRTRSAVIRKNVLSVYRYVHINDTVYLQNSKIYVRHAHN